MEYSIEHIVNNINSEQDGQLPFGMAVAASMAFVTLNPFRRWKSAYTGFCKAILDKVLCNLGFMLAYLMGKLQDIVQTNDFVMAEWWTKYKRPVKVYRPLVCITKDAYLCINDRF